MERADAESLPTLLDAWRAAERRLAAMAPDDPARAAVESEVERCRRTFHDAEAAARRVDPEPAESAS